MLQNDTIPSLKIANNKTLKTLYLKALLTAIYLYYVNVNIRMIKKWKIIMYKKWPKAFQIPSSNYYLSTEF